MTTTTSFAGSPECENFERAIKVLLDQHAPTQAHQAAISYLMRIARALYTTRIESEAIAEKQP